MKAVVVYESMYGNTREVAEAVAEGLRTDAEVEVHPVSEAGAVIPDGADLLVVGGPTHVHGMASRRSVKAAVDDAKKKQQEARLEPMVDGAVLRDWLDQLPTADRTPAAAFDTRIGKPRFVTGSAAKGIAQRLRRHGYELVSEPESFIVADSPGPLRAGELERAREWGRSLSTGAGRGPTRTDD